MKTSLLLYYVLLLWLPAMTQETEHTSPAMEQQLENLAHASETAAADDSYLQQQQHFQRHPLNINTASADELNELNILSGLQVQQLILYRNVFGKLVNRYELQAIPSWDVSTIKQLLPFITVTDDKSIAARLRDRWEGGDAVFIARYARILEKSKGYDKPADSSVSRYLGNRDKIYLRYSYNYKNLLQWGLLGDKDAGEQFFKGGQAHGFDFYSFHFFARKLGIIKALALGDFTVNLGQGLVQWQSLAFKKSAEVLNIKRQSATLRPYNSAGEYNFHRGAGIVIGKGRVEATAFVSIKKISAGTASDTALGDGTVSSFLTSGYHRTAAENENKNGLQQIAFGGNFTYKGSNWQAGINTVTHRFSKPVQKSGEPFNLYALQGVSLMNTSMDYSYTWRNIHFFGEAATDNLANTAFVNGAIASLSSNTDISVLHRKISKAYRSVNANAFTENSAPVNENGFYAGLSMRPATAWKLNVYADVFRFPWLKYRVAAPTSGTDYLVQATYIPNKMLELYLRYKQETKAINHSVTGNVETTIAAIPEKNLRLQTEMVVNRQLMLRNRAELLWYNTNTSADAGQGFLVYTEIFYKPQRQPWHGNMRLQYFETDGYNERMYTYESDLPYNFSIPFYYGKGVRYYCNLNWNASHWLNKIKQQKLKLNFWLKWAQAIYRDKSFLGSGLDETSGNRRSEIKFQLILNW